MVVLASSRSWVQPAVPEEEIKTNPALSTSAGMLMALSWVLRVVCLGALAPDCAVHLQFNSPLACYTHSQTDMISPRVFRGQGNG